MTMPSTKGVVRTLSAAAAVCLGGCSLPALVKIDTPAATVKALVTDETRPG
jgi:uncharacterized protein (UPF0210 family)